MRLTNRADIYTNSKGDKYCYFLRTLHRHSEGVYLILLAKQNMKNHSKDLRMYEIGI